MRPLLVLLIASAAALAQEYGDTVRFKIETSGGVRKGGLFLPRAGKKGEVLPLLIALPGDRDAKAFVELGPWQQPAFDKRFAVLSVDLLTATQKGWHPSEQPEMQTDIEAVLGGLEQSFEHARQAGYEIDRTAVVMTGWGGASHVTMWLGLRRPDLFLGLCIRSPLWFKETLKFSKSDKVEPNHDVYIYIYRGENDHSRAKKEGETARKMLKEAGYKRVTLDIVPKMIYESKPEVCVEWLVKLLKETARPRKERRRIGVEVAKLKEQIEAGKRGAYGKLVKLAEKEEKLGVKGGARAYLAEIEGAARKKLDHASELGKAESFAEAVKIYKEIEKGYTGLPVAKEARKLRSQLVKSGAYKAAEMLQKAKELLEKDQRERAFDLLEKIVDKYPESGAAAEAQALLRG